MALTAALIATVGCEPLPSTPSTIDLRHDCGNLSFDDKSNEIDCVKELQRLLKERGAQFRETGYFGKETRDAVQQFQHASSIPVTGIVAEKTKAKLYDRPLFGDWDLRTECVYLKQGAKGPCVVSLQHLLQPYSYGAELPGSATYAEKTAEAVRQFQRHHGLEVVGAVGPETKRKLYEELPSIVPFNPNVQVHDCPGPQCGVYLDRATTEGIANFFDNPLLKNLVTTFVSYIVCAPLRKVPGFKNARICEIIAQTAIDILRQFRQARDHGQCVRVGFEFTDERLLKPTELSRTGGEYCQG